MGEVRSPQEVTMNPSPDRLTLDVLLSDPLTQLVMRSDKITPADVAQAFAEAEVGLKQFHVDGGRPVKKLRAETKAEACSAPSDRARRAENAPGIELPRRRSLASPDFGRCRGARGAAHWIA